VGLGAGALPSRHALPPDVHVPVLPGLGLVWYDRGARYWTRRAGLSLLWLVVLALVGGFDTGLFSALRSSSRTGFEVFIAIDAVLTVALLAWFCVRTARRWNVARLPARASQPRFRFGTGWSGQLLSGLAQLGWILLMFACAIGLLVFPGLIIALFLMSLMPQTLPERQARLWLAARLRERGHLPPDPQDPHLR
jgi:hypothetical protein